MDAPSTNTANIVPATRTAEEIKEGKVYIKRFYLKNVLMAAFGLIMVMSAQWSLPKAERVKLEFSWPLQIAVSVVHFGILFGVRFLRRKFFSSQREIQGGDEETGAGLLVDGGVPGQAAGKDEQAVLVEDKAGIPKGVAA